MTENPWCGATVFVGVQRTGPFDVFGDLARHCHMALKNPNGQSDPKAIRQYSSSAEIIRRPEDTWIIDFGTVMDEAEASPVNIAL